jgi:hypothetical protein
VVETDLLKEDVPESVNLLVICGPKRPFQPDEIDRLRTFVVRDGQIIVLLGNADPSGLDEFLKTYNVELEKGITVDPRFNFQGRPNWIYASIPQGTSQPIVESLIGRFVLFPDSAPLIPLGGSPKKGVLSSPKLSNPGVTALPFLRSGSDSWVETNLEAGPISRDLPKDVAGPVNIGVAVAIAPLRAQDSPRPRMVILSSPLSADNRIVRLVPANLDLLMNAVQWLRGRPSAIGIDPKTHESLLFVADPGLRSRLVMVPTLLAVLVILGLGITTYLSRRD